MTRCQSRPTCRDILKKNWQLTISNTADNARIIHLLTRETRYGQMHKVNMYIYIYTVSYTHLTLPTIYSV